MPPRERLSADLIAEAALHMLDETGQNGFSMRKLAARLGVDPMAIYHHHKSKDALMHAVLNEMMRRCPIPAPGGTWQQDIQGLCRGMRKLAKMHPGAFCIYETYESWLPAEHQLHEAIYATLDRAGFDADTVSRAAQLLLTYVEAFAVDEVSGWLDLDHEPAYQASLEQGDYPTLMRLAKAGEPTDADAEFAFGLSVLIRGLEQELG